MTTPNPWGGLPPRRIDQWIAPSVGLPPPTVGNVFQRLVVFGTSGSGVFIYDGPPATGNLIGSWAPVAGVDPYGNAYPAGIFVNQGALYGVLLSSPQIVGAIITSSLLNAPLITQAAIGGGSMTQTAITFNSAGGTLLVYTTTTTTQTFSTPGAFQWTCPAGVTSALVECWGADASGGGGSNNYGGTGGGGGAYSAEPAYSLTPGTVYSGVVGTGGAAVSTGNPGNSGTQSSFDGSGVVANPGLAGTGDGTANPYVGGAGGAVSGNTVSYAGGSGGSNAGAFTGAAGGGGRAGSTGAGGNGSSSSGSAGAAGGAAGTGAGGHAGGTGGNASGSGSSGGGGGGAGQAPSGGSGQVTFDPIETQSFFGNGSLRNTNGDLYQNYSPGNPGGDGDQFAFWYYDGAAIFAALNGKTVTAAQVNITNLHSYNNSGMYAALGASSIDSGTHQGLQVDFIGEGANATFGLGSGFGPILVDGSNSVAITLGPAGSVGEAGNQAYYGYFSTLSGALTFFYETGSGNESSGAGANGQVKVTYASSSVLVCGVSPVSGTDAAGNAYAAGFTGPIAAIEPGSSPAVVETWHAPSSLGTNWATGSSTASQQPVRYRATPDGCVEIIGIVHSTAASPASTIWTMPSGYTPATSQRLGVTVNNNAGSALAGFIQISTAGAVSLQLPAIGATGEDVMFCVKYPLS